MNKSVAFAILQFVFFKYSYNMKKSCDNNTNSDNMTNNDKHIGANLARTNDSDTHKLLHKINSHTFLESKLANRDKPWVHSRIIRGKRKRDTKNEIKDFSQVCLHI